MGWSDDIRFPKKYNNLLKLKKKLNMKMRRKDTNMIY